MKKIYLTFCFIVFAVSSYAQDLSMDYYSYLYNWYNMNPAYCSKDDKLAAILNVRQRAGLNSNNSMLGIKGILGSNQGIGGRFISDNRGAFQVLKTDATYAYKLKITETHSIHFGVSAGLINKTLNITRIKNYESLDQSDPNLQSTNFKTNRFTAGAGIVYDFKNFEFSASSPSLIESSQKLSKNLILMVSDKFAVNNKINLTPILFYFNLPVVKNFAGVQLKADYKNMVWTQLGYQTTSVFNIGLGCNIGVIGIGYSYSTPNKLMLNQTSGTHEVVLKLKIANNPKSVALPNDVTPPVYSNKLNSIIEQLDKLTANKTTDKEQIKNELEKIKMELKDLLQKNFSGENPSEIERNLNIIESKIKELEAQLEK